MFELGGQKFMGLNGGPHFKINPSISFFVVCETEEEVNTAWEKLLKGGSVMMPIDQYDWSQRYGWLIDRYGVNWQLSMGKLEDVGQKFTPTLMFIEEQHGRAEEAINFYTSVFDNSSIEGVLRYSEEDPDETGTIKHAQFKLNENVFMAMDSGYDYDFQFNEGISLFVNCDTQEEIDYYWNTLTADGGKESMCGWLKDKFGVSWQIVPTILERLMSDPIRASRVMEAFMKMKKFDIDKLINA
jgi:predicted 3-demethylubiquinone-9 3-methyltransferase (glyoxalase superfamily)